MYQEIKDYYGTEDKDISICGVPHFDQHVQVRQRPKYQPILLKMGLHPDKPYLFFAMSSPRFAPHEIEILEKLAKQIELRPVRSSPSSS